MYAGQIVEDGTLEEIFYDPQHPYTWGLLGSLARLDQPRPTRLAADRRAAAVAAGPAIGLPLRPALLARVRRVHRAARRCRPASAVTIWTGAGWTPTRRRGCGRMTVLQGDPLLEVTDLVKHFPIKSGVVIDREVARVRAVDGVSLTLQRRRDAGPGRRIRLRQVDAVPGDPAADDADVGVGPVRTARNWSAGRAATCGRCAARCR